VDLADLRMSDGRFEAAGSPERAVSLAELAGRSGGFSARETFEIDRMTYSYGVHLAHVEVDPDAGGVRILGYFIGYEVGRGVAHDDLDAEGLGSGGDDGDQAARRGLGVAARARPFRRSTEQQPLVAARLGDDLPRVAIEDRTRITVTVY